MTSRIWSDAALLAALSYINEHLKDFRDDHAQGYEDCAFNLLQQKDIPTQFTPKQIQCKVVHLLNECFRGGLSHMRHVDQFFLYGTQVLKDSFWVDKINAKQFMSGLNALLPPGTPLFQQAVTTQRAQSQQMAKRLKNRLIHDQSPSSDQGLCSSNPHGSRQIDERVGRKRIHSQDAEQREELEEPLQRTACQQMDFASTGPKKLTLWFSGHAEIEDVGRREHRERPKRLRAGSPDTGPAPEQRLTSPDQAEPLSGAQRPSAVEDCSSGANQTQRPQRAQHRTTNGLTEKILEGSTAEHEQARPSTDTTAPPRGGFFSAQPALINDIGDEEIKKSMSAIQGMIKDTVMAFNRHTELDDIPFPDLQVIQHRYPALAKLIEQVLGVSNVASLAQAFATSGIKPLSTNGWLRALIGAAVTNDVFRASFPEELICNPTPFFAKLQKEWDSPEWTPLKTRWYHNARTRLLHSQTFTTADLPHRAAHLAFTLGTTLAPILLAARTPATVFGANAGHPLAVHLEWQRYRTDVYRQCLSLKARLCLLGESLRFEWPAPRMVAEPWWMRTEPGGEGGSWSWEEREGCGGGGAGCCVE